jgi:hypothetical protein
MRTQSLDITIGSPASPLPGESTAWDDERGDVVDVDVGGDARKGGLIANNVPGMGAGAPCGSHHPYDPDRNPRRAAGGGVGRPSPRSATPRTPPWGPPGSGRQG